MVSKKFYEQAYSEAAKGFIDQGLYIKVCSENPVASEASRRAYYIRARAREMALESSVKNTLHVIGSSGAVGANLARKLAKILMVVSASFFLGCLVGYPVYSWYYIDQSIQRLSADLATPIPANDTFAQTELQVSIEGGCKHLRTLYLQGDLWVSVDRHFVTSLTSSELKVLCRIPSE